MAASTVTTHRHIPVRDFFRNPEKNGFSISPDGMTIAFLQPHERRMNLFVESLESVLAQRSEPKRLTDSLDRDIRQYFWKGSQTLIYLRDFGGDENFHAFVVNREGGEVRDLTPFPGARVEIVDELHHDPDHILVSINDRDPSAADIYRLNIYTLERVLVAQNSGNIIGWLTDHDGKLRVAIGSDGVNQTLLYRGSEADPFEQIHTTNFRESHLPHLFTSNNRDLYVVSNVGRDKRALVQFDPRTKQEVHVVFEHPEVDVSGLVHSHWRNTLTEIDYLSWKAERIVLDPKWKQLYTKLEAKLSGQLLTVTSYDRTERLFTIRSSSDRVQGVVYLYDLEGDILTTLATLAAVEEDQLATVQPIQYRSRDGLQIHGYLTIPNGVSAKHLPIVVNPHGGPEYRDVWDYSPEIQFFANRGYAVLRMNFRGSTGYGRAFWEASFKQYGKAMQDDITDGVEWLIEQGIADPKRIAIYGGSYGGYCVLAGLAFTPDLYACGIDYVGISNLLTFLKTIPPYWKPLLESMYEKVGHPEHDKELLEQVSPAFHAEKIRAPLMVLQGAQDPRVNINESNQIVEALRKRGIEVDYIVKEDEGHGFMNEENKFEAYEAMEAFLAKHLT